MKNTERTFKWLFALVSAVVVWQLDIAVWISSAIAFLGVPSGTILHDILLNVCIPIIILSVTFIALRFYECVVWPCLPQCKRGWWVYSLAVNSTDPQVRVGGYFYFNHGSENAHITEARAYYINEASLQYRGDWTSRHVAVESGILYFRFSMRASTTIPQSLPSHYDGYFEVYRTTLIPFVGRELWSGYFNDLGDRRQLYGSVTAERLTRKQARNATEAKGILNEFVHRQISVKPTSSATIRCEQKLS